VQDRYLFATVALDAIAGLAGTKKTAGNAVSIIIPTSKRIGRDIL
jgi:hypothetical protein